MTLTPERVISSNRNLSLDFLVKQFLGDVHEFGIVTLENSRKMYNGLSLNESWHPSYYSNISTSAFTKTVVAVVVKVE